jgi:hypothetical protein
MHAGVKPFKCHKCHTGFISNWNLSKHLRRKECPPVRERNMLITNNDEKAEELI